MSLKKENGAQEKSFLKSSIQNSRTFIDELNSLEFIEKVAIGFLNFLKTGFGIFLTILLGLVLLSVLSFYFDNVPLISFAGLVWLTIWLLIFYFSINTSKDLDKKEEETI